MSGALQVQVVDRQQIVYVADFSGPVELGRQIDVQEGMYGARPVEAGGWRGVLSMLAEEQQRAAEESFRKGGLQRAIIAQLNEDTISRHHALIEPLGNGKVRLGNVSSKVPIRLPDEQDLPAGKSIELTLPCALGLGRKTVRLRGPESRPAKPQVSHLATAGVTPDPLVGGPPSGGIRRLDHPSIVPGQLSMSIAGTRLPTRSKDNVGIDEMIRWLQATVGVLQAAINSSDFFERAAQAVVEIVGCDRGRVLLVKGSDWKTEASFAAAHVVDDPDWRPSDTILLRVLEEKRTCWQTPDHDSSLPESLMGIEIVVASPILDKSGAVIGAIYGDCDFDNSSDARTRISRLEAILVDLLAGGVATGLARIEQEKAAMEADIRFGQFFTPQLSRQLVRNPDLLKGRDCDVTLMFVDIRGFSRISEKLGPGGTVEWIGDVMNVLSDCVLAHRGVLVDYIGDELLAMWGAPEEQPDHARLACRAALEMVAALPRLSEAWQPKLQEPIRLGIGVNTGKARVGNTGSKHKFKYGPLGHHVNLASRVQGATKYLRTPLLITEFTRQQLGDEFDVRRLCTVRVVNIAQPVDLYELALPEQPGWDDMKRSYEHALKEFELGPGHLRAVARSLGNLLSSHPEDGPAMLLISRAINALVAENALGNEPLAFDHVWELPGK